MNRVSTRCELLDRRLNGGLPEGAIASLVSSPSSQCSPLFYGFLRTGSWLYVTTHRSEVAVSEELDELLWGDVRIERVGVDRPVENLRSMLREIDAGRNVLVDTMNPLEATDENVPYTDALNELKRYLLETDAIALFHCTEYAQGPPLQRETTLSISDVVLELETFEEGTEIKTRLKVPKCRGMQLSDEIIKLDLDQGISVDTSKNIA